MSILSSIVPGLRELRTPLTAGLIWLAAIVTFGVTRHATLMSHTEVTTQLHQLSTVFAAALAGSAIVTGGFLLGNAITGITSPLLQLTGRYLQKLVSNVIKFIGRPKWIPGHRLLGRQSYNFDTSTRTISNSARGLIMEANARELAKAGVPGSAALLFPLEETIDSLAFTAPQLSQTAPTQYQEYGRVRSEIAFRMAVVPAIVALTAVLLFMASCGYFQR